MSWWSKVFPDGESNPGRRGESAKSWPLDHLGMHFYFGWFRSVSWIDAQLVMHRECKFIWLAFFVTWNNCDHASAKSDLNGGMVLHNIKSIALHCLSYCKTDTSLTSFCRDLLCNVANTVFFGRIGCTHKNVYILSFLEIRNRDT